MKLSKSKLTLAKVINENGGWVDESANWAVQPKHEGGDVWFSTSESKPYSPRGGRGFTFKGYGVWLGVTVKFDKVLGGWHQTVLSREEYYQAYPKADDGWIEWNADGKSDSPIGNDVYVDVKLRCGSEHLGQLVSSDSWMDLWGDESIVAYRPHKPELKPEFCESVMRSIPEPEAKPTIEQLAADYRNKLDYANRKQQEAEDAKMAADAAIGELVAAGKAIDLVIGIATPEPELVITDWLDLIERDVIWFGGDDEQGAGEYSVLEVEHADYGGNRSIRIDTIGSDYWIDVTDDWKFIRRP